MSDTERAPELPVGVVLGSEDAGPLEFWVGVSEGRFLQLDDLVTVEAVVDGEVVSFFGIVDVVRKRYEGAQFDSDAFRASEGILPVDVSYAAHVQVTRIDPEVFVPPHPGSEVRIVRGEQFRRALFIDRMERKVAIGGTRAGETVYANLDFLDGERGAHASISGISGVATKTSYATFLLYSLFHSDALGRDAANARAIIFNVKGEDLLWLDKENAKIDEDAAASYRALGLNADRSRTSASSPRPGATARCSSPRSAAATKVCGRTRGRSASSPATACCASSSPRARTPARSSRS